MDNAENRLRVVAALALLRDGAASAGLADYMSGADRTIFSQEVKSFPDTEDRGEKMEKIIRRMAAQERFTSLAEVHPAWILEKLVNEPPRIIGIILRALPAKHAVYILKNMPPMLRVQIPDIAQSFAVPAPVMEVIRRRFERHFLPMRVSKSQDGFENISCLKEEELYELVREMGLTELAMALSGLPARTLAFVYNRLKLKDAKRLKRRMGEIKGERINLIRQARRAIFEIGGSRLGPDRMLLRIGLAALAMAIYPDEADLTRLLQQRFEPAEGYLLKKFVDERRARFDVEEANIRRSLVLESITSLTKEGRIAVELPSAVFNEETVTVQLA